MGVFVIKFQLACIQERPTWNPSTVFCLVSSLGPGEAQVLTLFLVIHGTGGNFWSVLSPVVGRTLRGSEEGIGVPHS